MFQRLGSDSFHDEESVDQFVCHLYGEKDTVNVNADREIKLMKHTKNETGRHSLSSGNCAMSMLQSSQTENAPMSTGLYNVDESRLIA